MLPTKVLLALSSLLLVHAYKIEIDVQNDSVTQVDDQVPIMGDEPMFNATVEGHLSQQLEPFACPSTTCAGSATCKSGDKTIRLASDGSPFYLHCGMGIYNNKYNKNELTEPTFESCIDRCTETPWCMAVNYETPTKKCWRLSNYNYPGGTNTRWEAALKMTTTRKVTAQCPEHDGQLIKTKFRTYKLHCDNELTGFDLMNDVHETYEGAAERCDNTPGCVAVVRRYNDKRCFFKSASASPPNKPTEKSKSVALLVPVSALTQRPCCGGSLASKSALELGGHDEV